MRLSLLLVSMANKMPSPWYVHCSFIHTSVDLSLSLSLSLSPPPFLPSSLPPSPYSSDFSVVESMRKSSRGVRSFRIYKTMVSPLGVLTMKHYDRYRTVICCNASFYYYISFDQKLTLLHATSRHFCFKSAQA